MSTALAQELIAIMNVFDKVNRLGRFENIPGNSFKAQQFWNVKTAPLEHNSVSTKLTLSVALPETLS